MCDCDICQGRYLVILHPAENAELHNHCKELLDALVVEHNWLQYSVVKELDMTKIVVSWPVARDIYESFVHSCQLCEE